MDLAPAHVEVNPGQRMHTRIAHIDSVQHQQGLPDRGVGRTVLLVRVANLGHCRASPHRDPTDATQEPDHRLAQDERRDEQDRGQRAPRPQRVDAYRAGEIVGSRRQRCQQADAECRPPPRCRATDEYGDEQLQ
jgi:hypothetical protein